MMNTRYRLTYRIEPQVEMASGERNNNPLKFVVTSYVRDKEVKGENMKIRKGALVIALLMAAHICNAAVRKPLHHETRLSVITLKIRLLLTVQSNTTTLVFDDDETVISAEQASPGMVGE